MNKVIELDHENRKESLNLIIFCFERGEQRGHTISSQAIATIKITN